MRNFLMIRRFSTKNFTNCSDYSSNRRNNSNDYKNNENLNKSLFKFQKISKTNCVNMRILFKFCFNLSSYFLFICIVSAILSWNLVECWREASKCTSSLSDNLNEEDLQSSNLDSLSSNSLNSESQFLSNAINTNNNNINNNNNNPRALKLDCGNDLIFIAWSHYGHQQNIDKQQQNKLQKKQFTNNVNSINYKPNLSQTNDSCYFSPKDCIVSVDYVANECNGLSTCLINLDAQYLHSCKSYSDYLFIIYDCIEAKSTVNICDQNAQIESSNLSNKNNDEIIYIQTPNYPNEYFNNLDCNCSMRTSSDTSFQIELLEFDLESSSIDNGASSGIVSLNNNNNNLNDVIINNNIEPIRYLSPEMSMKSPKSADALKQSMSSSNNYCSKDYFSIGDGIQLCGTLSPFLNLANIQKRQKKSIKSSNLLQQSSSQITKLRFSSDDALARRGFWIKIKASKFKEVECPENFILVDNICIRVFNELLTWYEAQNYCSEMGYSLAMIDNFELDKQLNKVLFNEEDGQFSASSIEFNLNKNNFNKFWIGIKHLNQTNWFDSKNDVIRFREDEMKWWPWLVVDSSTYNEGSCVGKRRNWFFLEDCYKRMPFACQYKPNLVNSNRLKSKIQLKCGKNSDLFFQTTTTTPPTELTTPDSLAISSTKTSLTSSKLSFTLSSTTSTKSTTQIADKKNIDLILPALENVPSKSETIFKQENLNSDPEQITANQQVLISKDEKLDLNETNLAFTIKKSPIDAKLSTDSTLLISLIASITLLIAFINSIVIIVLCKRRKLLIQQQNSEKESKMSQDTISSGHNINLDDTNGGCSGGLNSTSSLTFSKNNPLLSNFINNTNQSSLFSQNSQEQHQQRSNMNNVRRSLFVNNFERSSNNLSTNTISTTLASGKTQMSKNQKFENSTNFKNQSLFSNNCRNMQQIQNNANNNNNNQLQQQQTSRANDNSTTNDPLTHIYETISVSSVSNGNLALASRLNSNNTYNLFNHYHLHQSNQLNHYNDIECDLEQQIVANSINNNPNYNDLSLTDSSASQKSQEFFIINSDTSNKKANKHKQVHKLNNNNNNNSNNQNSNKLFNNCPRGMTGNFTNINNENKTHHKKTNQQQHQHQHHQQQQQQQQQQFQQSTIFDRNSNRFSDINLSTNTSSPSSTSTTMTDIIPSSNQMPTTHFKTNQFILNQQSNQLQPIHHHSSKNTIALSASSSGHGEFQFQNSNNTVSTSLVLPPNQQQAFNTTTNSHLQLQTHARSSFKNLNHQLINNFDKIHSYQQQQQQHLIRDFQNKDNNILINQGNGSSLNFLSNHVEAVV